QTFKSIKVWITPKLPTTFWGKRQFKKPLKGAALKMELAINDDISMIIVAESIKKEKWPLTHFWPTEEAEEVAPPKPKKTLSANYTGASAFKFGFARLKQLKEVVEKDHMAHKSTQIYIDTTGQVAFNA